MTKHKKRHRQTTGNTNCDPNSPADKNDRHSASQHDGLSYLDRVNGNYLQAVTLYIDSRSWHPAIKAILKTIFLTIMIGLSICLLSWPFLRILQSLHQ